MRNLGRLSGSVFFYGLLLYAALLLFSINYQAIVPGLDTSWGFALNYFAHGPELFGKDLILTYGPLGYLDVPENFGSNLLICAVVHILIWCVLLYAIVMLWEAGGKVGSLFITIGLICSNRLYFNYWDYLLSAVLLVALLVMMRKPESVSALVLFILIVGISSLVKFSAFVLAMLMLAIYAGSRLLQWNRVTVRERALLLLAFASGPISYLIYNPSLTGLIGYFHGSLSMASGYSAGMSLPSEGDLLMKAGIMSCVLVACVATAAFRRWISPAGAAMVLVAGWLAFKHGYVRIGASHAAMYFCFSILVFAFLLAQMSYTLRRGLVFGALFAGFTVFGLQGASARWPVWNRYWWSPSVNLSQAAQLVSWKQATAMLDRMSEDGFRSAVVNDYLAVFRNKRVLFFPWDVAYGIRGSFHTVPLYATQAYTSYTHYLDARGADAIANAVPPIDYVLFEWKAIDFRNPLLDVPATWHSLLTNFEPASTKNDEVLLKRRTRPLALTFREISNSGCPVGEWISVPSRNTPVAASFSLPPTPAGRITAMLYQLGSVSLEIETRAKLSMQIRFPPDVLSSPFPINYLPLNTPMLNELWTGNLVKDPITRFRLTGPGLASLHCETVRFYDLLGTPIVIG